MTKQEASKYIEKCGECRGGCKPYSNDFHCSTCNPNNVACSFFNSCPSCNQGWVPKMKECDFCKNKQNVMADSGGFTPQGEPIYIPVNCPKCKTGQVPIGTPEQIKEAIKEK